MQVFDPDLALEVGVHASLVLGYLLEGIPHRLVHGDYDKDRAVWDDNNTEVWGEIFFYMDELDIKAAFAKMVRLGVMVEKSEGGVTKIAINPNQYPRFGLSKYVEDGDD